MKNKFSNSVLKSTVNKYGDLDVKSIIVNSDDFNKTLRQYVNIANKRIARIDNAKKNSVAVNHLKELGYNDGFKLRGMSPDDKYKMMSDVLGFLQQPTSTLTGTNQYIKDFANEHNIDIDVANQIVGTQEEVKDFVYTLSNEQYYATIKGFWSIDELASDVGFDKDINEYLVELEHGTSDLHTMYFSLLDKLDRDIPDNINLEL